MNPQATENPGGGLIAFRTASFLSLTHFINVAKQHLGCVRPFMAHFQNVNIKATALFASHSVANKTLKETPETLNYTHPPGLSQGML